jgi:hypothetical protein
MPYDWSSGLVFSEKIAHQSSKGTITQEAARCVGLRPQYVSPALGAESLKQKAMRSLLRNLNDLDVTSLSTVPVNMLEELWRTICEKYDCFTTISMTA